MRPLILAIPALLLLSACAGMGASNDPDGMQALSESCAQRGGVLVPTGADTGRPSTEFACSITGSTQPLRQ